MEGGINVEVGNGSSQKPQIETAVTQKVVPNQILEKERKPGDPKINIHIFYSPHGTIKDLDQLGKVLRNTDVYIPEKPGWIPQYLKRLREISAGEIKPRDGAYASEYKDILEENVYNTHKAIVFIDEPAGNANFQKSEKLMFPYITLGKNTFKESLLSIREYMSKLADAEKKREAFMANQLQEAMRGVLEAYPQLREKKEINVLLSLGAFHTGLYHLLKKENLDTTRSFNKNPFVYSFSFELIRRYRFHENVGDELVAMTLMEIAFNNTLANNITEDADKFSLMRRRIISAFSFEEIGNMFESVKNWRELKAKLVRMLSKKGINLPTSEKELEEFLAKPLTQPNSSIPSTGLSKLLNKIFRI